MKKPSFELTKIMSDGSTEAPEIVPVERLPWETKTSRRGFLGAGLAAGAVLAITVVGCKKEDNGDPSTSLPVSLFAESGQIRRMFFLTDGTLIILFSNQASYWDWGQRKRGGAISFYGTYVFRTNSSSMYFDNNSIPLRVELKSVVWGTSYFDDEFNFSGQKPNTRCRFIVLLSGLRFITSFISLNKLYIHEYQSAGHFIELEVIENFYKYEDFKDPAPLLTPDETLLICPQGKDIGLFSLITKSEFLRINAHEDAIVDIALSPDGKLLISISKKGDLKIWNLPDGTLAKSLQVDATALSALALSPDGQRLAASAESGKLFVWKFPELEQTCLFEGENYQGNVLAISHDNKNLLAATSGIVKIWDLETCEYTGFLFQKEINYEDAVFYNVEKTTASGSAIITYTLPCGSPIPAGATCTCNCVNGVLPDPPPITGGGGGGGGGCQCNSVCTCVPVCQAHRLIDPDPAVRLIAKEILLIMGKKEWDYLEWALAEAKTARLKTRIRQVMNLIKDNTEPTPSKWPNAGKLEMLLSSPDPVVSLMAAQMFGQLQLNGHNIPLRLLPKIKSIFNRGQQMHWKINSRKRLQA